jgi:hypothetical protein
MRYRHELKYIISKELATVLKERLKLVMEIDKNSKYKDNTYLIRSLYFDDVNSTAYYEKLSGVIERKKYRIRYYNNDPSFIKLECKHKNNNLTYKEHQTISKDIVLKIINNDIDDIPLDNDNLLTKFIIDKKLYNLVPSIIVDYYRLAYTYIVSDVRVTFDENVKSGIYNYNLFDKDISSLPVIKNNDVVLEIKFNDILPLHIANILATIPMIRQAISKYATCRSVK